MLADCKLKELRKRGWRRLLSSEKTQRRQELRWRQYARRTVGSLRVGVGARSRCFFSCDVDLCASTSCQGAPAADWLGKEEGLSPLGPSAVCNQRHPVRSWPRSCELTVFYLLHALHATSLLRLTFTFVPVPSAISTRHGSSPCGPAGLCTCRDGSHEPAFEGRC